MEKDINIDNLVKAIYKVAITDIRKFCKRKKGYINFITAWDFILYGKMSKILNVEPDWVVLQLKKDKYKIPFNVMDYYLELMQKSKRNKVAWYDKSVFIETAERIKNWLLENY